MSNLIKRLKAVHLRFKQLTWEEQLWYMNDNHSSVMEN